MIENKGIGSKIFDVINVVILVLITLICILPVWYVLCVSLSSREAVNAGQVALWPVGFNLLSYQKILGESDFFGSFLVSVKRVVLGTGVSMVCILLAAYPLSRTKKQFPKRDIFMWIFVFCMLFNGGTVPWYVTMKNYGLMDSIWGLVLGMGLQVFNVILAVNFFKNLPVELEEACFVDGGGPWRNLFSIYIPLAKPMVATISLFTIVQYWNEFSCHFFKSCAEITPAHPDLFSRVFRAQLLPDVLIHIQDDSSKRTDIIFLRRTAAYFIDVFPPAANPVQHLLNRIQRRELSFPA